MHYVVVAHENLFPLGLIGKRILWRHGSGWLSSESSIRSLNVLENFFGYDVGADVRVLGEEDDDFVTGNADSHVGTACICHSKGDELTHHQVQIKRGEMRCK